MIYEFLESKPPFYDANRKIMFNKILNIHMYNQTMKEVLTKVEKKYGPGKLIFIFCLLEKHSELNVLICVIDLKDLLQKLLAKDKNDRLGSVNGADDIISHPWFK
jgi:serine/threonine protein kinase